MRTYTPEEAAAEIPALREQLARIRSSRRALIESSERITDAVAADGGGVAGSDWFARDILLRDADGGLVDFPSEREGRIVFLCWNAHEDELAFWHEQDSGFIGRRPL